MKQVSDCCQCDLVASQCSLLQPVGTRCDGDKFYHIISPQIIDTDWNDDFIVVKRDADDLTDIPENSEWYIIDVQGQIVYGPLQFDKYIDKRNELSVPRDLELLSP